MMKIPIFFESLAITLFLIPTAFAKDPNFDFSGVINSNYQYQEFAETEKSKLQFSDLTLNLDYQNNHWSGTATVRCYRTEELCDFTVLSDAYFSYQFDPSKLLKVGLQPIPFGVDTYWDASNYESLMFSLGMQDTHNWGFRYDQQLQQHQLSLGYFPVDGGNYIGSSPDASRYSANFIQGSSADTTHIKEQHMLFGKYSYNQQFSNSDFSLGTSIWYSILDNQNTHKTGTRLNTNFFTQTKNENVETTLTFGYQDIDNAQDNLNYSTMGSFDSEYNLANQAYYYVTDFGYNIPNRYQNFTGFRPYLIFSGLLKTDNMPNSYRHIAGLQFDYRQLRINAEYIFARNDVFIGGDMNAFADSQDREWKQLVYINFGFNF